MKKLNDIKNERKQLRTQLDQFQKNFEDTHKRKIRYTKDIVPVQNEFKRYKDLKVDIAKLE
jgi:peptidoglycan hydrolase CwlO-like protein